MLKSESCPKRGKMRLSCCMPGRRYRDVWTYAPSVDFYRPADERDGNQPGQHFLPAAGGQTTVLCPDGAGSGGQCPLSSELFVRGRGTRAIRNTIECTLREHSIVMNRIFDAFRCFAARFCSWNGALFEPSCKQFSMRA